MDQDSKRETPTGGQYGHSGTPADTLDYFTFPEAAHALVYELNGKYVPKLETALTPIGTLYHDWIERLKDASCEDDHPLQVCVFEGDKSKTEYIQRGDLQNWCLRHGMRPKFLFPKSSSIDFGVVGYDAPPELAVMLEAINQFWVNADPAAPPKKGDLTDEGAGTLKWIRERVDSDSKANAIDLLIRPEWARPGGNKKKAKG